MTKEAIILAGGLGTRLRSVVKDVPKPMADINGKPFLEYLLSNLKKQGIEKVILSVGYKYEIIKNYFGNSFLNMKILYSIEDKPLGTGGGIRKSLSFVESEDVFIINGDTIFDIDLSALFSFHKKKKSALTLALKSMKRFSRYGSVELNKQGRIIGFKEKGYHKSGLVNGGIYVLAKEVLEDFKIEKPFSFEKDFLEVYYTILPFFGMSFENYFVDIGIPEDYERFKKDAIALNFLT